MSQTEELFCLKEIFKDIRDLQSLSQFKEYELTQKQALTQLNAIVKNIKSNFTDFINCQ